SRTRTKPSVSSPGETSRCGGLPTRVRTLRDRCATWAVPDWPYARAGAGGAGARSQPVDDGRDATRSVWAVHGDHSKDVGGTTCYKRAARAACGRGGEQRAVAAAASAPRTRLPDLPA